MSSIFKIVLTQSEKQVNNDKLKDLQSQEFNQLSNQNSVRIKKGSSFWSIIDDFKSIYDNFNLLSYFSSSCEVCIIDRIQGNSKNQWISIDYFSLKNSERLFMVLTAKDEVNPYQLPELSTPLKIHYQIYKPKFDDICKKKLLIPNLKDCQKLGQILVQFKTQFQKVINKNILLLHMRNKKRCIQQHRELIEIQINDKNNWIFKNLGKVQLQNQHHRISPPRKSKISEIQYFYKEPISQRFKNIQTEHISLALQGGGCKGVLYIGAYQAILKNKPDTKIKSIIGSSAGSIIGLAICCGLTPQQIIEICETKLSKITSDKKFKHSDNNRRLIQDTWDNFFSSLIQMNIFEPKIVGIIQDYLGDEKFQELLLKLLQIVTNSEVIKLFTNQNENKLNMAGILNASLMSGKIISLIVVDCISKLLLKLYKNKNQKFLNQYNLSNYQENGIQFRLLLSSIAQKLSMKQLYELTDIEFTCTAVDVDNYILRFFNQKTTPDLPVCKAVQMSSSFPFAFQALKWQSNWGKYYIHYNTIRRQIDLTGCQFTDGGTLANFPVNYLDNQDMRPMYFSHVKTDQTIMYGIGLKSQKPKETNNKSQKIEEILKEMGQLFKNKIGVCSTVFSMLCYKINCCSNNKKQIRNFDELVKRITSIPFIQYGIKLLLTYCNTKDNLTQQCYSHLTYETTMGANYKKQIQLRPTNKEFYANLEYICEQIKKNIPQYEQSKRLSSLQIYQNFKSNIFYLRQAKQAKLLSEQQLCQVADILNLNFGNFLHELFKKINGKNDKKQMIEKFKSLIKQKLKYQKVNEQGISDIFQKIQRVTKEKIFMLSEIERDFQEIDKIMEIYLQFCAFLENYQSCKEQEIDKNPQNPIISEKNGQQQKILYQVLKQIHLNEIKIVKNMIECLVHINNQKMGINNIDRSALNILDQIWQVSITLNIQNIKNIIEILENCQISQFFVHFQAFKKRNNIKSYIQKRINNYYNRPQTTNQVPNLVKPDGLHIVIQSISLSELYFHEYYLILQDTLLKYNEEVLNDKNKNTNPIKVSTMTGTSYHSIIMFLHASGLPDQRVGEQVGRIRDLLKIDLSKFKDFDKGKWTKVTPILLRQAQKMAIERKKDVFGYVEEFLVTNKSSSNKQFNELKSSVSKQIRAIRISNEQMIESIQVSLNYVSNILIQIQEQKLRQQNLQKLSKTLVLNKPFQYLEQFKKKSDNFMSVTNFFIEKYKDIFQYLVYQSPLIIDQITKVLKPEQRKQAWKIAFLNEIVSGLRIKKYIQTLLQELKLQPNITLKQFYDNSSKKIQLNFSVIEDSYVSIFNYITRPNMPVWAAILAASSIPEFISPVFDRPQWRIKTEMDFNKRKVKSYFEAQSKPYKLLTSSEFITRLPLDLLTNQKFQNRVTDKKNQIFIVFNFQPYKLPSLSRQLKNKMVVTSLSLGQLITKFVSFRSIMRQKIGCKKKEQSQISNQLNQPYEQISKLKSLGMINLIPGFQSKLRLIKLFIESNDNLMCELYKRQVILMPVRFDTLDFHLLAKIDERTKKKTTGLSDICEDSIMQSYFILSQKIQNRYHHEMKNKHLPKQKQSQQEILKIKENIRSKRVIYLRIQSHNLIDSSIQKQKLSDERQFNISQDQPSTCKIKSMKDANKSQYKKLTVRFLSLLCPSGELFQKYHIYIDEKNDGSYRRQISQQLIINQLQWKQIHLKIEYPSSNLTRIKKRYLEVNFQELFDCNVAKKNNKNNMSEFSDQETQWKENQQFAFIYCIQFDKIYGKQKVSPIHGFQVDYMNRNNLIINAPALLLKSQIKKTYFDSSICQNCFQPFHIEKSSKIQNNLSECSYYICKKCNITHKLTDKYYIYIDNQFGKLTCRKGHTLTGRQSLKKSYQNMDIHHYSCDLCGKGLYSWHWIDQSCQISICDECRISYTYNKSE